MARLLEEPAEDADELAERIIDAIDELREKREQYAVLYVEPNTKSVTLFGPYGTENAGRKDMFKLTSPGPQLARAGVLKLRPLADG